jgi:squalene monooxygenase
MVATLRREVATRPGVAVKLGQRVDSLLSSGGRAIGVRTADGAEHRAGLVVLADGRQSKLRESLGLAPQVRLLSYTVAFGVEGELPSPGFGHVFLGAPGPILSYPYGAGRVRFCVDVPLTTPKGRDAIAASLKREYAPFVPAGLRPTMLAALDAAPFEACATHAISTEACAAPGVVLVGDSGGCAHPLTASGMTNAMNDVLTLAEVFARVGPTNAGLEEYQRRRYDFVRMRELFTDSLYEVFKGHDVGSQALRAGVFRYWGSSERSRQASMDILSGEDVRTTTFVKEYARVMGVSAVDVLKGLRRRPALRERSRTMRSLVKTSLTRIEDAVQKTARTVTDRYRLKLRQVPEAPR